MKLNHLIFSVIALPLILQLTGCPTPNDSEQAITITAVEDLILTTPETIGDIGELRLGTEVINMIYANDQNLVAFPIGTDDSGSDTVDTPFFIAETELTNQQLVLILQWAYIIGKFNSEGASLDKYDAQFGSREIVDLNDNDIRIEFDSGQFKVTEGFENHPASCISWYGAIILCNWLTEIRDGNNENVVYGGITSDWDDEDTTEDRNRTGYRLPGKEEWEYAARYRGTDSTNSAEGYLNPYFTKGNSASGASGPFYNMEATQNVAVYRYHENEQGLYGAYSELSNVGRKAVKSRSEESHNSLGCYDMSGNIREWCFDLYNTTSRRVIRGGRWSSPSGSLQIGDASSTSMYENPGVGNVGDGMRLCRSSINIE